MQSDSTDHVKIWPQLFLKRFDGTFRWIYPLVTIQWITQLVLVAFTYSIVIYESTLILFE